MGVCWSAGAPQGTVACRHARAELFFGCEPGSLEAIDDSALLKAQATAADKARELDEICARSIELPAEIGIDYLPIRLREAPTEARGCGGGFTLSAHDVPSFREGPCQI